MRVTEELRKHIEEDVFPIYAKNEPAHNLNHIQYVIDRSFRFAQTVPGLKDDIVYVVAAYHDIGHHIDPKNHEKVSAEMMQKDKKLKQFFTKAELKIIKEAIEDHRSSSDHDPRSIYGKIVSTADRNDKVEACLFRSYSYGRNLHPDYTDEQLFERAHHHLMTKFGEGGYAKFYFQDDEYDSFLKEIRELMADKEKFIATQRAYIEKCKSEGRL